MKKTCRHMINIIRVIEPNIINHESSKKYNTRT